MAKFSCNVDAFRHSNKPHEYAYKVLSELGFDAVEPEVIDGRCIYEIYHYCPLISLEEDPVKIKKIISSYGLEVSCVSAHTSLLTMDYGTRYLKRAIKFADKLNAPIVNTSEGPKPEGMTDEEAFRLIEFNLEDVVKMAENYGIYITIEPHGVYTTTANGLIKILNLVNSDILAINFDTGNVYLSGNNPVSTLKAVADRVMYTHIKDIGGALIYQRGKVTGVPVGVAIGQGNVDIRGCVNVLKKAGYKGAYSIECDEKDLQSSLSYLKSIV